MTNPTNPQPFQVKPFLDQIAAHKAMIDELCAQAPGEAQSLDTRTQIDVSFDEWLQAFTSEVLPPTDLHFNPSVVGTGFNYHAVYEQDDTRLTVSTTGTQESIDHAAIQAMIVELNL